jgi:hypothetical protein
MQNMDSGCKLGPGCVGVGAPTPGITHQGGRKNVLMPWKKQI